MCNDRDDNCDGDIDEGMDPDGDGYRSERCPDGNDGDGDDGDADVVLVAPHDDTGALIGGGVFVDWAPR